ncbi:aldehyde dehydrogenase [Arthrobacter alpinus]|uniref:aldehyde dehydrogenase (NAD(+)) n=2 Tax=Arthrobacter TaxID=1663 RepID=A0A0M5LWV5_9MICC|nr:aldehyde dehydrogenase [Arthrobacter alpinus]
MQSSTSFDNLYIDGTWVPTITSAQPIEVENPYTHETVGQVPRGTSADVDAAVRAASTALPAWEATPAVERALYLERIAQELANRSEEIAQLITAEVGTPLRISQKVQAALPVQTLNETAAALRAFNFTSQIGHSVVQRPPVGVVGAITPWNYPLHQIVGKVGGALAAGCTLVLKPSDLAPLSAFVLAEVVASVGLPAGVFNVVSGPGSEIGQALVDHPEVALVSFTGSTAVGRQIAARSGDLVKRVSLELGGKSASIVLPDADLATAVKVTVANSFLNAGQTCTAWSRLLVPRELLPEVEALAAAAASRYVPGDPMESGTRLGPLVSKKQRDSVLGHITEAVSNGATVLCGGSDGGTETGYFVEATVLSNVAPGSVAEQEEMFGPVLSIVAYDDVEEAVAIANGTKYGLAAGVWSADPEAAINVAGRLLAGQVDINGAAFNPAAPFGGFKQSGYGREFGTFGIEEFLTVRSIQM